VWQAGIAAQERDRAQAEAAKAEQINAFLQGMFASANPVEQGRDVKVAEVLDAAAEQVGRELAAQPEIEAAVRRTLGITYQDIGLYNEAEQQLSRALALRRKHLGSEHPETAQSLKDYALVRHWQGDLDTAARYYRDALALFYRLGKPTVGYAEALNDYGLLRMDQADYQAADSLFRAALQMYLAVEPDRVEVASTLNNLALARHWLGDVDAADTLYHQALNRFQQRASDFITTAQTLNNLAWVYLDRSDLLTADSLFRASLALRRKHLGDEHPDVALALNNLAMLVYLPQGNDQAADSLLQEALTINQQVVPGDHPYTSNVLHSLGLVRMAQARLDEAETYFRASLAMRRALYQDAEDHPVIAASRVELGTCLAAQHRYAEAETLLLEGLAGLEASGDVRVPDARQRLADLYDAWDKPEQATAYRPSSSAE
jgi:tetratricopeptide (TPR) repeat protein